MQDLTLVGLTEDKSSLVLVSSSGEEFRLPADAKLRAALRGDHARLGQLEIEMESALRPRDIQARIRAGATPEAVAQAAQTSVDKIMSYATPVLAERAHIADRAQRASVRRKAGDGPARLLGDAVAERLRSRNLDPQAVEWDAWRRDDGRWTLVADYRSGEQRHHAEFTFDAPGRYVVAEDDEARWLVGEHSTRKGPQPRTGGSPGGRRLSAVSAEEELPLGADAIDLVSEPTGDADWIATQASDRPAVTQVPVGHDPASTTAAPSDHPDAGLEGHETPQTPPESRETAADPALEHPDEPAQKKGSRKGRRTVPSWDEIMFGGGRSE